MLQRRRSWLHLLMWRVGRSLWRSLKEQHQEQHQEQHLRTHQTKIITARQRRLRAAWHNGRQQPAKTALLAPLVAMLHHVSLGPVMLPPATTPTPASCW